jgi:hypothetical protein
MGYARQIGAQQFGEQDVDHTDVEDVTHLQHAIAIVELAIIRAVPPPRAQSETG